jgi:transcriptional regulator with XRE-family HTH domain
LRAAHEPRGAHRNRRSGEAVDAVNHPSGAAISTEEFRTKELGDLLRRCRERHPPPESSADAPHRSAGLTQQDAATLLEVGERHYRDFERGRLRHPEPAFLDQVAAKLAMSAAEREVLYHLACGHPPVRPVSRANLAAMQEWIDGVPGHPALVTDLAWNILLWNRDALAMFGDLAAIPAPERNAILWMFSPAAQQRLLEVDKEHPVLVGRVHTAYLSARGTHPGLNRLAERLLEIPEAAKWWHAADLEAEPLILTRRARRPDGTILKLRSISTTVPLQDLRLIVFTLVDSPPGTATPP